MASRNFAGLLLSVVIILLAFDYSSANGDYEGTGTDGKWLSKTREAMLIHSEAFDVNGRKNLGGRKMLQRMDGVQSNIPVEGKNEPSALTEPQKDSTDDSKAWVEEANEVANLMCKDYKGTDRARRKPPIHNHEPNN